MAEPRSSWSSSLAGALLGFGAPLGYFGLQRLLRARREPMAYAYMTAATPVVFALFGRVLGRQREALRRSHARLEEQREEFAALVSRGLENPLRRTLGQLDELIRNVPTGFVNVPVATLEELRRGGVRVSRMIDDLLTAVQLEGASLHAAIEPVALRPALEAVIERARPLLVPHAIELTVEEETAPLAADPRRLEQVALYLLEHAARRSPSGAPLRLSIRGSAGAAVFTVSDRGEVLAPAEHARVFERFSSHGPGLFLARGLVEAQRGKMWIESDAEGGTRVSVLLPLWNPHVPD